MLKLGAFPVKSRAYDRVAFERSAHLSASALVFLSPEDVNLSKLERFEARDLGSECRSSDIPGAIRMQTNGLDLAYLRRWAPVPALSGSLERGLIEARV